MSFPVISIIIPNYNHSAYLKQRIDSVLAQSYQNFEVIILDDCSIDKSRDVIEEYRFEPKVTHLEFNKVNTGSPFKQWKKGIELSKGEFIWIAESDDYADTHFLEVMTGALLKNPNVGLAYCDSHIVIRNDIQFETFADNKNRKLKTKRWSFDHVNNGINEIENFVMAHGTINNTSAVLFRKRAIEQSLPFDIVFRFIGDKYAFIKILSKSDVAYVAKPLNYYRASDNARPKHTNDYMDYVYEDFKIFDWIDRSLTINRQKFTAAFQLNSENSLLKGWNIKKIEMYRELMNINFSLFCKFLFLNTVRTFKRLYKK
jgi:glycosyltransferase involved in cell wall biosynthesis